jgi:hypothetical protein
VGISTIESYWHTCTEGSVTKSQLQSSQVTKFLITKVPRYKNAEWKLPNYKVVKFQNSIEYSGLSPIVSQDGVMKNRGVHGVRKIPIKLTCQLPPTSAMWRPACVSHMWCVCIFIYIYICSAWTLPWENYISSSGSNIKWNNLWHIVSHSHLPPPPAPCAHFPPGPLPPQLPTSAHSTPTSQKSRIFFHSFLWQSLWLVSRSTAQVVTRLSDFFLHKSIVGPVSFTSPTVSSLELFLLLAVAVFQNFSRSTV